MTLRAALAKWGVQTIAAREETTARILLIFCQIEAEKLIIPQIVSRAFGKVTWRVGTM